MFWQHILKNIPILSSNTHNFDNSNDLLWLELRKHLLAGASVTGSLAFSGIFGLSLGWVSVSLLKGLRRLLVLAVLVLPLSDTALILFNLSATSYWPGVNATNEKSECQHYYPLLFIKWHLITIVNLTSNGVVPICEESENEGMGEI